MAVTRNDVARAAGVSSAVVSYVLNDGPRPVSAAARARVLAAIDDLGYRPDAVARSLRTRTTQSLGLVLPDIAFPYFAEATQRVSESAATRGLSVMIATSHGSLDAEKAHLRELAGRRVDGIILMSVAPDGDRAWATRLGVPVAIVDRPEATIAGAAAAVDHLASHGHQRLARISGPAGAVTTSRRDQGWEQGLTSHRGRLEGAVHRAETTAAGGAQAALAIFDDGPMPDAIVVDTAPQATGVLRAAADRGLSVPGDLALVTFDARDQGRFAVPRLTSFDAPIGTIARDAVAALSDAAPGDALIELSPPDFEVHLRESCGHDSAASSAATST